MSAALIAGAISGLVGLTVFLTIHHFLIQPIWFIFPIGAVLAGIGGLAVGWAYESLRPRLPASPWTIPALVGLILLILLPALIMAQIREPIFRIGPDGAALAVSKGRAVYIIVLDLLVTSAVVGGFAGWLIGGTAQSAYRTALAGFVFALGPGHNIPFFSFRLGGVGKAWLLLGAIILKSAVTLVLVERELRVK